MTSIRYIGNKVIERVARNQQYILWSNNKSGFCNIKAVNINRHK
jgi:hypothetical protein